MLDDIVVFALNEEAPNLFKEYSNVFEIGVGKVNASIHTMYLINKYKPKRVINLGTAGGLTVGTGIYRINKFFQHDVNMMPLGLKPGQILSDDLSVIEIEGEGKSCASGDIFVTEPNKLRLNCDIIEMEAYAVAKACIITNIDFEVYKYITDAGDSAASKDWVEAVASGEMLYRHILNKLEVNLKEKKTTNG
jgi:adenosylhomocysteine nucleosidase